MKVYLVSRKADWCEDQAMVIIAADKLHAERRARWSSEHFRNEKNLNIKEIKLDNEQVCLISNMGA